MKCCLSSSEFLEAGRLEFGEARKTCATFPMCCILSSEFRVCFILRFRALKWSKSSNSQPDLTRILGLGKLILAIWKFCDFFRVVVKIFNPRSRWTKLKPHLRDLCLWKTQIFAQFAIENGDLLTRPRPNFHVRINSLPNIPDSSDFEPKDRTWRNPCVIGLRRAPSHGGPISSVETYRTNIH